MKLKILALFTLMLSATHMVYGQWDAQFSYYWQVKPYYNPAFAGETDRVENTVIHRSQWVGLDNAPKSTMAIMHMPVEFLGKKHGVGMYVFNDKAGLFSNTTTSLQYAYRFDFKKGRILSVGLQGAMANIEFDASKIHIPTYQEDGEVSIPDLPGGGSDKAIDAGLGVSWITPQYYAGLSVTHLWEPTFDLDDTHSSFIGRTYYLTGGYNLKLNNPLFTALPSVLIKSDAVTTQIDLTARMEYARLLNGGIGWRKDDGFTFMLGIKIRNFEAGYAYDLNTSAISKVSNGSHEIFLRYSIPLETKKERGTQKSIRLL